MGIYLDRIKKPNDIKKIHKEHFEELAEEIREYLVNTVSETGGHLASSLGAVELTMALHLCMDLPNDKIIWDVGHQAYVHKILTGRKDKMKSLRKLGGISGFPSEEESRCDAFSTGHATTSLAVAAGYARARDILKENYKIAAVIGDGSFSGGMGFEALNNLGQYKNSNTVVIFNDNNMSISKNVGGMAGYLERMRTSSAYIEFKGGIERTLNKTAPGAKAADGLRKTKNFIRDLMTPGEFFKEMGFGYFGPIDGHNLKDLVRTIKAAQTYKGTAIVHIYTKKGKGYEPAEKNPSKFHGIEPFDVATGRIKNPVCGKSYTAVFGETMLKLAEKDDKLCAITAAMSSGTGLDAFAEKYPERFFDVGIAEEYAVTFAGGLAAGGMHPVVAVYSTFLQRSYDQILHDVCLTGKKVIFAVDRAGIVGNDGKTHQGIYDISYLGNIPGLTVVSPKDGKELVAALEFAADFNGPIAVRYPRGKAYESGFDMAPIEYGKAELIAGGKDMGIIAVGSAFEAASVAALRLESEADLSVSLFNARFVSPVDTRMLDAMLECRHELIVTVEEGIKSGGFGQKVESYLLEKGYKGAFLNISLPDIYLEHGDADELRKKYGLDEDGIYDKILACAKEKISFLRREEKADEGKA